MLDQRRIVIENVFPQLNGGLFFIKRVVGESIAVKADVFADGHDVIACCLKYKHHQEKIWHEVRMLHRENDVWEATFTVDKQGFYSYCVEGWIDHALNWHHGTLRKIEDGQKITSELLEGITHIEAVRDQVSPSKKKYLDTITLWFSHDSDYEKAVAELHTGQLPEIFRAHPKKFLAHQSSPLRVYVDREKARFSTWYEFFPRSAATVPGKHGTFKDCEKLLPRVAKMGFDVLYFPPVHPIGNLNRKGKNNGVTAQPDDVGSPWAIGSIQGGHTSIHPELGTLDDFKTLVKKAKQQGIEIAMDFALQAAPDHPYVKQYPQWFKWRPDGTVQYAENPPKKYQDILPIYFETNDWKSLWKTLLDIAIFWIEECGVQIFRVDNPHTKPFLFWGWFIDRIKQKHPDVLFLSEAFTRPKVMQELAKQGFTQSYTYFTWRNSKQELTEYIAELTQTDQKEFFRPNFWPNTPDINPYALQGANETTYMQRYFMAATLSANTGLYGPVFEHMAAAAIPEKEEYANSEKYQLRHWDWEKENKLTHIITKINTIRKAQPSLQQTHNITFCDTDSDMLMAYYKYTTDKTNETFVVVNLDTYYTKQGWVKVPLYELGIREGQQIQMEDLLTGSIYIWDKEWCFVELHPSLPFHLFKINK